MAEVLSAEDRAVRLLDSISRLSVRHQFMPAKGSNRCIAATGPSVSNPILHTTDRWFSVPCNQVFTKQPDSKAPLNTGFPASDCK